jgi:L-histidine N-alpha-methyltransferase
MLQTDTEAAAELRACLLRPLPEIPSKYFYDDRGSALFDEITRLPEYYPTRTEEALLESVAASVIDRVRPRELAEIGSGVGRKIRLLLDEMRVRHLAERCVLFDINELFLASSIRRLRREYPSLDVRGVVGDFVRGVEGLGTGGARLVLFLAGTIGNLLPAEAARLVRQVRAQMEAGDAFLVGFDLVKSKARLEAAYNDAAGVTAAFNLNILSAVNDRFDANFDLDDFEHVAFYDERHARIEMRLRARRACRVRVFDLELSFARGDEILTEVSCKYTRESVEALAGAGGLVLDRLFTDPEHLFGLGLMRR